MVASSAAESSEMENAPLTVPEATPGTIAAGDDTISVKQASVPGTSPNKESTHLKISLRPCTSCAALSSVWH